MRFYQRSQISVLYAACGPPVLAPGRERIRPPPIVYLPIVTCRGTATEGGILPVFCQKKKRILESIQEGLPKGQGYRLGNIEDGIKTKNSGVSISDSILMAVDIISVNGNLEDKLRETESNDIFDVYLFGPGGAPSDVKEKVSLFTGWMKLTAEDVIASCDAHTEYRHEAVIVEDLMLMKSTVLNSIDDEKLLRSVTSILTSYDYEDRTGPLALWLLLNEITHCDEPTLDVISAGLGSLSLSLYDNEDVKQHGATWQKAIAFLKPYGKVPVDAKTKLLEQYAKCSVAVFRAHFRTLELTNDPRLATISSIIHEGTLKEGSFKSRGLWNPVKKKGAAFHARTDEKGGNGNDKSGVKGAKPTHDRSGRPIDRTPPKQGEPKSRKHPTTGMEEFWCGNPRCSRWGNHPTAKHEEWFAELKARGCTRQNKKKDDDDGNEDRNQAPLTMPRSNFGQVVSGSIAAHF